MATTIAFFDAKSYDIKSFDGLNKDYGFNIEYFKEHLSLKTLPLAKEADVVCIFVNAECDKKVIDGLVANGVKLIALRCAGFNNVDLKAAKGKIKVVRVPAYSPHAVAEYAVTLMLSLNRKVYRAVNRTRDGNFKLSGLLGFDMYGKTVGVIGMGRVAKVLIEILRGFGMNVLAYDLYPDKKFAEEHQVKIVGLDELYRNSDIISLHCPLTPDTKFMINKDSIAKMKPGIMIINTGRGKLIHTEDLIEGLRTKKVGSAGLDVYEEEQNYFYEDLSEKMIDDDVLARLLMMPNVILTSHQAFFTKEALHNIGKTTLDSVKAFSEGQPLVNEIKA
ncbi:MAG: 2-hydroxyacid dehydrogenase [Prevotella sp.]|jgi:D-lactate dehydrogenase|nr:2-hydroxyacid dehydrogenase [Prevotella sp.]MCH3994373.1 2-hydroxyacid dehydrogenase [Prevotella sp.]